MEMFDAVEKVIEFSHEPQKRQFEQIQLVFAKMTLPQWFAWNIDCISYFHLKLQGWLFQTLNLTSPKRFFLKRQWCLLFFVITWALLLLLGSAWLFLLFLRGVNETQLIPSKIVHVNIAKFKNAMSPRFNNNS